jgi:Ca-activated chloride channel family protein
MMEHILPVIRFVNPEWLFGIPAIVLFFVGQYFFRARGRSARGVDVPSVFLLKAVVRKVTFLRFGGSVLRVLALCFILIAMARPQIGKQTRDRSADGVDIMLVVDTSGSMKARDFVIDGNRPTRLEVIKRVIGEFIEARPDDRIGLVVFGTEAFTQAPLTLDHQVLLQFLDQIEIGVAGEATAIGDGLGTAVARLKDEKSDARKGSRVVVLLTDGSSNAGRMDPLAATAAAKALEVRVHTIGVGSKGEVPIISNGREMYIRADIDEKLLSDIATQTGGIYRRVTDTDGLREVYGEIDQLEKKKIKANKYNSGNDIFYLPLFLAILLLGFEILWRGSRWREIST